MNNKGQVLVIFVIILPIFLILLTLLIDLGLMSIEKRKIENNTYDAILYYLENKDDKNIEEKTKKLLKENINDIDIEINDLLDYIEIKVKKQYKNILNDEIIVIYKGIKEDNRIIKG